MIRQITGFFTVRNRTLLRQLVITDFKLRYQGSVLGYVWSLLKPLMMFGVLYLVFTLIFDLGKDFEHYASYLLLGVVLWTFFVEATTMGMGAIVGRADLLRKVKISKPSVVIAAILSALVNLALNSIIVIVFMIADRAEVNWTLVAFIPLLLLELILLATALSFFLSAMYVKYRDLAPIWEIILQMMFYATPIIYLLSDERVSLIVAKVLNLNPLAQIMQDFREILINPQTITAHEVLNPWLSYGLPVASILILGILSVLYFRRQSKMFAEDL